MALLRPRIAEVDVEAVDFALAEDVLDVVDVKDKQAHILELFLRDLLGRRIEHILLHLDADVVDVRVELSQLADEIALARAELDMKGRLAAEDFRPLALLLLADLLVTAHDKIIEFVNGFIHPRLSS